MKYQVNTYVYRRHLFVYLFDLNLLMQIWMVPLEQIFYFYFYFLPLEQFCTFLLDCSSKHGLSIKHLEILNLYLFICTVKKEDLLSSGVASLDYLKWCLNHWICCSVMPCCEILMMYFCEAIWGTDVKGAIQTEVRICS